MKHESVSLGAYCIYVNWVHGLLTDAILHPCDDWSPAKIRIISRNLHSAGTASGSKRKGHIS